MYNYKNGCQKGLKQGWQLLLATMIAVVMIAIIVNVGHKNVAFAAGNVTGTGQYVTNLTLDTENTYDWNVAGYTPGPSIAPNTTLSAAAPNTSSLLNDRSTGNNPVYNIGSNPTDFAGSDIITTNLNVRATNTTSNHLGTFTLDNDAPKYEVFVFVTNTATTTPIYTSLTGAGYLQSPYQIKGYVSGSKTYTGFRKVFNAGDAVTLYELTEASPTIMYFVIVRPYSDNDRYVRNFAADPSVSANSYWTISTLITAADVPNNNYSKLYPDTPNFIVHSNTASKLSGGTLIDPVTSMKAFATPSPAGATIATFTTPVDSDVYIFTPKSTPAPWITNAGYVSEPETKLIRGDWSSSTQTLTTNGTYHGYVQRFNAGSTVTLGSQSDSSYSMYLVVVKPVVTLVTPTIAVNGATAVNYEYYKPFDPVAQDVSVIVALYEKSTGLMKGCYQEEISPVASATSNIRQLTTSFALQSGTEYYVKAFAWNSLDGMRPIAKEVESASVTP